MKNKKPASKSTKGQDKNMLKPNRDTLAFASHVKSMETKGLRWHNVVLENLTGEKASTETVKEATKMAKTIWEKQVSVYEAKKVSQPSSDDKYIKTMLKSGTLADRIAVLTLSITSSGIHQLHLISNLITMAKKKARRESQLALESLKDLFLNNLLPDRKLRFLSQQPLCHKEATPVVITMWYVEHYVKMAFAELIAALELGLNDPIENYKRVCITVLYELLSGKAEQEHVLLGMMVNKLGDPDRKVAAKIMYLLQELLKVHPQMKSIVANDVERLLSRPNVKDRTMYNAILFLNQLYLSESEEDAALATHLISVYFSLFAKTVNMAKQTGVKPKKKKRFIKKGDKKEVKTTKTTPEDATARIMLGQKLLSALLTGVNRAFPYAKIINEDLIQHIDDTFRVVHTSSFSTSVQALMLLFQVLSSNSETASETTTPISDRFYTALYAKLHDPEISKTSKHKLFLNLLYKSLKGDKSLPRKSAMLKRLLHIATWMSPAFACAALFLTSEIMASCPALRSMIDDGEEHLVVDSSVEEQQSEELDHEIKITAEEEDQMASILNSVCADQEEVQENKCTTTITTYDALKRNPLYVNAENSCLWELHNLLTHYHPSVAHFATQLSTGKVHYSGDPLVDFTLPLFLEKYVTKKSKAKDGPTRKHASDTSTVQEHGWNFHSEAFAACEEEDVNVDDVFFHTYFKQNAQRHPNAFVKDTTVEDIEGQGGEVLEEGDYEDPAMETFAQELAEGLMEDDVDDEDDDFSEEDDDDDAGEEEDDDEENVDDDDDDDNVEAEEDDTDDDDADEGMDMFGNEDDEEDDVEEKKSKNKTSKRKSPFASADDYDALIAKGTLKKKPFRKE